MIGLAGRRKRQVASAGAMAGARRQNLYPTRPNRRENFLVASVLLLVVLLCSTSLADARSPSAVNQTIYAWSDLNHYEILNLNSTPGRQRLIPKKEREAERAAVTRTEVKRAYYTQAKRHHPDKATVRGTPVQTMEESTSRMAQIASAYEVLYHEHKKRTYDWVLLVEELSEELKNQYAADLGKKRCEHDNDCDMGAGECCIKYHFEFCGVLSSYPAKGLECLGPVRGSVCSGSE